MNLRHVASVFRKDGLELLRDRRTLFVNVVLPVLLYPLMLLFLIQVWQLTQAHRPPPPRIALIGLDARVADLLRSPEPKRVEDAQAQPSAKDTASPVPTVLLVDLPDPARAELLSLALRLHESRGDDARRLAAKSALLARLRQDDADLTAVAVDLGPDDRGRRRVVVAGDDAHPQFDTAHGSLLKALRAWSRELATATATAVGLNASDLDPVAIEEIGLASSAQAVRSRLAGMIPLLLVVMAVSGAFYPALDLIAGERERGTLETLLSWPVARRDLFLGKLLVTVCAAALAVVLNLLSLGVTVGLAGAQLGGAGGGQMSDLLAVGAGTLALSFLTLLPLVVTLSAASLALAGFAASSKEAQNYLTPLFLVVVMAAAVAQVPDARPSLALDLVPITGPVLALKEALRATAIPWFDLALSTAASIAVAAVVVAWSTRLLDEESFCYPGLVRAGWGRWRRWGERPTAPGGLEALGVFAVAAGGLILGGGLLGGSPPLTLALLPLPLFVAGPALLHAWLGAYRSRDLHLGAPDPGTWPRALLAAPLALILSLAIFALQPAPPPTGGQASEQIAEIVQALQIGGWPLLLYGLAILPAFCEELLCRGTLLAGLRRGLGPVAAVVLSAFCFATLHLTPYRFLPQFAVGLVLALLALRCRSIWPGVLIHAAHNAGALVLGDILGEDASFSPAMALVVAPLAVTGLWILVRPVARPEGPARIPAP